jgi:hypothetical protein
VSYSTVIEVRNALSPSPDGDPWDDGEQPDASQSTNTAADLTNEQLLDSIAEADSLIDSFLGLYYIVPVVYMADGVTPYTAPIVPLAYWSRNLAAYYATLVFRKSQDFTDQDPVARRYLATLSYLQLVGANKMVLPFPPAIGDTAGEGAGSPINPYGGQNMFQPRDFSLVYAHDAGFPWGFGGQAYLSQLDYPWPT